MNREEALEVFRNSEEIVTAEQVNRSVDTMAKAIKDAIGDEFPMVLSVMSVFISPLLRCAWRCHPIPAVSKPVATSWSSVIFSGKPCRPAGSML